MGRTMKFEVQSSKFKVVRVGVWDRISIYEKPRAQAKRSKFQTPSSKEAPGPNHQTPTSREAPSSKFQARSAAQRFGAWNLGFLWCLELGFWCFDSGISLELGVWCLVFCSAAAQKLRCARCRSCAHQGAHSTLAPRHWTGSLIATLRASRVPQKCQ